MGPAWDLLTCHLRQIQICSLIPDECLFCYHPGHVEKFPSMVGRPSVHYGLEASFIPGWESLFLEPKLALRMETNGKRMCIWAHIVVFMPLGTRHVARIRIYVLNVNSSSPQGIAPMKDENWVLKNKETHTKYVGHLVRYKSLHRISLEKKGCQL